jgi:hypothetical protein
MRNIGHNSSMLVVASLFLLLCHRSPAQTAQGGLAPTLPSASAASYYYVSKPGELTMQVNIWGYVRNPGRYEIPTSTDLVQLVSFAGGPSQGADMNDVHVTRFLRKESGITRQRISVDLENLENVELSKLTLYPGDTIFIDNTSWTTIRDAFTIVTTAAVVTSAVASVIIATNYSNR